MYPSGQAKIPQSTLAPHCWQNAESGDNVAPQLAHERAAGDGAAAAGVAGVGAEAGWLDGAGAAPVAGGLEGAGADPTCP
jgi:hypothetical protein